MAVLKVNNLVKDYGSLRAVDDVSFQVNPGEIVGLLGLNGAGKTSIISTIVTLENITSGRVTVDDKKIGRKEKAIIGFVPQEIITHGYFSVEEILQFQSGYYGLLYNQDQNQKLMKQLGLWEHRYKKVRQLSGGMRRRLMIAKALVHQPQVLLLDEPTAGVDVELRYSIWDQVRELKKSGVAILFTTHYLEEAEQLCDRVIIIHKGKMEKQGDTKDLIHQLTFRRLIFILRENTDCSHPDLFRQEGKKLEFHIPYSKEVGSFLSELNFPNDNILDLKIQEGSLEDAFKRTLKKENVH